MLFICGRGEKFKKKYFKRSITFQWDFCRLRRTCVDTSAEDYPWRICFAFKPTTGLAPAVLSLNKFGLTEPYANLQVCAMWSINEAQRWRILMLILSGITVVGIFWCGLWLTVRWASRQPGWRQRRYLHIQYWMGWRRPFGASMAKCTRLDCRLFCQLITCQIRLKVSCEK